MAREPGSEQEPGLARAQRREPGSARAQMLVREPRLAPAREPRSVQGLGLARVPAQDERQGLKTACRFQMSSLHLFQ